MKTSIFNILLTLPFILQLGFTQPAEAQTWTPLGSGIGTTGAFVAALTADSNYLYSAGILDEAGDNFANGIAEWNGSWSAMGAGIDFDYDVIALAIYDSNVIVGGYFDTAGSNTAFNMARWNGSAWSPLGSGVGLGLDDTTSEVYSLGVNNGLLYAGGYFQVAGGNTAYNIAEWNGSTSTWSALGSGIGTGAGDTSSAVFAIAAGSDTATYAGGYFNVAGSLTAYNVARWDGTYWSALGQGIGTGAGDTYSYISSMAIYNGNLYVGGQFQVAGGTTAYNIAEWNISTSTWSALGSGIGGGAGDDTSQVYALTVYNGNLFVGGYFNVAGGDTAYNIAEWNGSSWVPMGSPALNAGIGNGIGDDSSGVYALTPYGGNLYIGGYFDQAGGQQAANIVEWQPAAAGISKVDQNNEVSVYPNPSDGMLNIALQGIMQASVLQIYDMLGNRIYQSQIANGNTSIDLNSEAKGAYMYRVCNEDGSLISTGKFLLQ